MQVLIAEDDRVLSLLLQKRLKMRGVNTLVAYDAMQAIMLASRNQLDAILLDINMPGGTGLEVLKRVKASNRTNSIPVITFSADKDPGLPDRLKELGAEEFLHKPFEFENLYDALRHAVDGFEAPEPASVQQGGFE